ncbi:MAG: DUF3105 domain-containing protein [Actinomycetia bacterium]|nr:DUF3105 domain-containing protein [Actinomycetes bacterium]
MPTPVVASAWGEQVSLDSADDARSALFIRANENEPTTPEPGAASSGGIGYRQ